MMLTMLVLLGDSDVVFPCFSGRFSRAPGEIQHPPCLDSFEEKK